MYMHREQNSDGNSNGKGQLLSWGWTLRALSSQCIEGSQYPCDSASQKEHQEVPSGLNCRAGHGCHIRAQEVLTNSSAPLVWDLSWNPAVLPVWGCRIGWASTLGKSIFWPEATPSSHLTSGVSLPGTLSVLDGCLAHGSLQNTAPELPFLPHV